MQAWQGSVFVGRVVSVVTAVMWLWYRESLLMWNVDNLVLWGVSIALSQHAIPTFLRFLIARYRTSPGPRVVRPLDAA